MNAVAERAAAAVAESNTVSLFERLAKDPAVDVAKLEKLMELNERALATQARGSYAVAMAEAQGDMRPIAADANNPQTKSKYASYSALDKALRPIYTKHGFALSFDTGETTADAVEVLCEVLHVGGHSKTHRIRMPADGKGAKGGDVMTKTHATGAAMSYGMRYLLKMIFNVAVGEDDDDGNAPPVLMTEDHQATIRAKCDEIGDKGLLERVVESYRPTCKAKTIADVPDAEYARIIGRLQATADAAKTAKK